MKPFPVPRRGPAAAARNIRHKDPVRPPSHPCADLQAFTSKFHKLLRSSRAGSVQQSFCIGFAMQKLLIRWVNHESGIWHGKPLLETKEKLHCGRTTLPML